MKSFFRVSFCVMFFSAIFFAMPTFAADWSLVIRGQAHSFRSVRQIGSDLIATANQGALFRSSDNGTTWSALTTNASAWFLDLISLSNGDLIAVGEGGAGILSSDQGTTWSQISMGVTQSLFAASSKSENGYMVGSQGTFLSRNTDTGNWTTKSFSTTDDFFGVEDLGGGNAFVVGTNGDIYRVLQTGLSYVKIIVSTKETLRAVRFVDALHGWIVGTNGTILKTTDGGSTWDSVSVTGVSTQTLYAIDVQGDRLAIAGDRVLILSEDAGKTWNVKSFADTFDVFYDVVIAKDGSAVAVGSDYDVASLVYAAPVVSVPVAVSNPTLSNGYPQAAPLQTSEQNTLIKLACATNADVNDSCRAVYFYATDGKRHAFPNERVYFSWFTDFSTVKEVSSEFLASLTLGKNVTYRPGVKMVKFQTSAQVYAVAKGGVLRPIPNEVMASALYGTDWNKKIDDIADVFYLNYTFGASIAQASDYDPTSTKNLVGGISENL